MRTNQNEETQRRVAFEPKTAYTAAAKLRCPHLDTAVEEGPPFVLPVVGQPNRIEGLDEILVGETWMKIKRDKKDYKKAIIKMSGTAKIKMGKN